MLDQRCVGGELGSSDSPGIKRANVFRIRSQALFLDGECLLDKRFNLLGGMWIGRAVAGIDKTVVRILTGAQGADAIELVKQYSVQQVIDRIRVVRMPLLNLGELLNRAVIIHVVEPLEGGGV